MTKSLRADLSLLLVTIFWGAGFPATKIALQTMTPFYHIGIRFAVASLLLAILFYKKLRNINKSLIKPALILSSLLFGVYAFQTVGIQYTTASKSSFFSGLAVLLVPIFSIFYSFAAYAFFFEDKRGGKAIKRSQELVKGYFWPIIGRFLLLFIVLWTAEILITIPLSKLAVESLAWNFYYYFVQVFNFIITPISILFSYQIFKDLARIKK